MRRAVQGPEEPRAVVSGTVTMLPSMRYGYNAAMAAFEAIASIASVAVVVVVVVVVVGVAVVCMCLKTHLASLQRQIPIALRRPMHVARLGA